MRETTKSQKAATRWVTRVIPAMILLAVGYATYAVIVRMCVDYLMVKRNQSGSAIALIVLYVLFLFLSVACYLRTLITVKFNTGLVPLPPRAEGDAANNEKDSYGGLPDTNPDSPGLEQFYSRDVFVCESDGKPKWCHVCRNWKPDRSHHSSELERCVYKMDHFCPWVGGMVAESSYKYFTQFVTYCSCFLLVCLATSVHCLVLQKQEAGDQDPQVLVVLVISAFFSFFAVVMTITTVRLILLNLTNIDTLRRNHVFQLAVRVPLETPPSNSFTTVTYPLPRPLPQQPQPTAVQTDGPSPSPEPVTDRDHLARYKFAIVRTEAGENPWDLGIWRNWQSVMGNNLIDYLLPIRPPPCANHDDMQSLYPMGSVLDKTKKRHNIPSSGGEAKSSGQNKRGTSQRED